MDANEYDYARYIREYGGETYENGEPVAHVRVVPFTTYGASASEECLIESNYDAALEIMRADGADMDNDVYSYRGYMVAELYREGPDAVRDSRYGFTRAAIVAFSILASLEDYPCLDESDFSDREYTAWSEAIADELRYLAHDDDSEADITAIDARFYDVYSDCGMHSFSPDDIGPDIEEHYTHARDAYFDERASEHYTAQILGQQSFPL